MKPLNSDTRILITGGAGFVGSQMAQFFRELYPRGQIVVFDNLKRRGSELNLPRLKALRVEFVHGDIRNRDDFEALIANNSKGFDVFIEASAEPSVLAGLHSSPLYAIDTNLGGTINCLEFARRHCGQFIFLSTSRVYSIPKLLSLPLISRGNRFEFDFQKSQQSLQGISEKGISETFSTSEFRSLYGTTKLSSEMLIEEYVHTYGLKAVINRCGVLCGPWQMGKVDQGVFMLWMARHTYGGTLSYTGFGGKGFQVRDLLHPRDLFNLVVKQLSPGAHWNAQIYNVGGGKDRSSSLAELTEICQNIAGREIAMGSNPESASVDIPWYITDSTRAQTQFSWQPQKSLREIMSEIHSWLKEHETTLRPLLDTTNPPVGH